MAFDSRLHAAYLEEGPDPRELSAEHLRALEDAEPHPIMDFFRGLWRRIVFLFKLTLFLGLVGAYPVSILLSHKIDDSDIVFADGQNWAFPESGIAITKIARELEGKGWAADKPNWHPQARLTAMPAWQEATADGLSEFTRLVAGAVPGAEGEPDSDLLAASRLLKGLPGEDMRPRLTAAAEALNRFDSRASRKVVDLPERRSLAAEEARMFAGWAEADQDDLSTQIYQEATGWPASKQDIRVFYAAKARAHIALQMLKAARSADRVSAGDAETVAAYDRAEAAWTRAARIRPLMVSNQKGDGAVMSNHLASLGFFLRDAQRTSLELAEMLGKPVAPPEGEVAQVETQVASATP
ncbi:MAG: hypothetical protein R3C08_00275 [Hyphomonas sp.]|nr:hypothetical protein [Hyphomonas sp.]HRX72504.1 hypothetical protein [Hyphomonas sp.]